MTTNLSYSTYQNPPSTESLKQFSKHQSDQTESNVMSRKLKVTALVMCFLVLGAFLLSSEIIHRKQSLSKNVSVTTDAPKSIPIYIDTEEGTTETKEEEAVYIPPVENKVEYVAIQEEEQQEEEVVDEDEGSSSSSSSTVKPAMPDAPTDTTEPVLPPVASLDAGDPLHPRVSNAASMPVKVIRSDARLSPLYMSYATTEFGWLRTLFSKYGFVGNRLTDPKKYTFPEATLSTGYTVRFSGLSITKLVATLSNTQMLDNKLATNLPILHIFFRVSQTLGRLQPCTMALTAALPAKVSKLFLRAWQVLPITCAYRSQVATASASLQ